MKRRIVKGIVLFLVVTILFSSYVEARRVKNIPLTISPLHVIHVESFPQLVIQQFPEFQIKEGIFCGLDLGAGDGKKTTIIKQALEQIFGQGFVSYWGIDRSAWRARMEGNAVMEEDVQNLINNDNFKNRFDIITIFAPAGALELFVTAAKKMIKEDGLIIVSLYRPEMLQLFEGQAIMDFESAEEVLRILSDFTLVGFRDLSGWPDDFLSSSYAFVYSPKGIKAIK